MPYPFQNTGHRPSINPYIWLRAAYDTFRVSRRERRKDPSIDLHPVNKRADLRSSDIPIVFISHNDINLLPAFLTHYRQLGVTRFICVDDQSKDGSHDYLASQPDVDLWTSSVRYADARRGRRWRETLFGIYGKNRWYLNVDSDEFLVFADCNSRSLSELFEALERAGDKRLAAPMLDMYGAQEQYPAKGDELMPWTIADHFDRKGYAIRARKRGIRLTGGPRHRRFSENNELIKYPVIFWDDDCFFGSSPHSPLPFTRNFPETWGALLHLKFYIDYKQKIAEAAREGQHFNGSIYYKRMEEELKAKGSIDLYDEAISTRYVGPEQLIDLGFITPIDWAGR